MISIQINSVMRFFKETIQYSFVYVPIFMVFNLFFLMSSWGDTLNKYDHLYKYDQKSLEPLSKKEKKSVIEKIVPMLRQQITALKSLKIQLKYYSCETNPLSRQIFLDSLFSLNFTNTNEMKAFVKKTDKFVREGELDDTENYNDFWGTYELWEEIGGRKRLDYTWDDSYSHSTVTTLNGNLHHNFSHKQIVVHSYEEKFSVQKKWQEFFTFPFYDDKLTDIFKKDYCHLFKTDKFLVFQFKFENQFVRTIYCDPNNFQVVCSRNYNKNGTIINENYQFNWEKYRFDLSFPKIIIDIDYVSADNKSEVEFFSIYRLEKIDINNPISEDIFRVSGKKGTKVLDFRSQQKKIFMLEDDTPDVLSFVLQKNPIVDFSAENKEQEYYFYVRIICVVCGLILVLLSLRKKKISR
ncbi:MAG: hypothetical protein LBE12_01315 [Planctomycetaceae bacterium]|jgi:hypothetical protein|nr:hypothetical protein [Planctomycetaceae bacterium]